MADPVVSNLIDIFSVGSLAFVLAFALTPLLTNVLYKARLGKSIREGKTPVFTKLHKKKAGTPTGGGILVWGTVLILALLFLLLGPVLKISFITEHLHFLTREQTLLPLGVLVITAIVGLIDDIFNAKRIGPFGGGLRMRYKLIVYTAIAAFGSWWFFYKLGFDILHVPGIGDFSIGWWYIPLFIFVPAATSSFE